MCLKASAHFSAVSRIRKILESLQLRRRTTPTTLAYFGQQLSVARSRLGFNWTYIVLLSPSSILLYYSFVISRSERLDILLPICAAINQEFTEIPIPSVPSENGHTGAGNHRTVRLGVLVGSTTLQHPIKASKTTRSLQQESSSYLHLTSLQWLSSKYQVLNSLTKTETRSSCVVQD